MGRIFPWCAYRRSILYTCCSIVNGGYRLDGENIVGFFPPDNHAARNHGQKYIRPSLVAKERHAHQGKPYRVALALNAFWLTSRISGI
jgi:hypothetical protein